jgi:hypothetical protein
MLPKQQVPGKIVRFIVPLLVVLRDFGGSGTAAEITDEVIRRTEIGPAELAEFLKNGQSKIRNQIAWARFYLVKAGFLANQKHGVWVLTEQGMKTPVDGVDGGVIFLEVRAQLKRLAEEQDGTGALLESDDEPSVSSDASGVESDNDEDSFSVGEPYDASAAHIITKLMSVEQVAQRLRHEEIDLEPDFQRRADLWTPERQSRLIESMLIRIPLPTFYFDATDETKWVVVDGLQRLGTIQRFMVPPTEKNSYPRLQLRGLEYLQQLNGKTFSQLPRPMQRRIEEAQITAHLIQPGTPIEVKYNVFKRINTGGLVLTAQEIRNAIFQQKKGGANQFLRELAITPEFLTATTQSISSERMLDCEFVLRFIAFSMTDYNHYRTASMDAFLNQHMRQLNEQGEGAARDNLRRRFKQAMAAAYRIFSDDAFRKRYAPSEARRPINKALFEALSVSLGNLSEAQIENLVNKKGAVKTELMHLLQIDKDFEMAITQGTGDVRRVHKRFRSLENIFEQILGVS